ncbi:hypothetical protein [Methylocystis echinoides]|uniref:Glycoside hydrolase 123 C-terminal domain-containing protein n=1 Tax=Methylocystis echinoides TaxID=29468 RepID=A0A9W6GXT2_9HYPH|nr:hypothetical protein [Methylocystis echinoides]GLI94923.1 hypothetical protein LMG27198_39150 [Methylocystis echinoides]
MKILQMLAALLLIGSFDAAAETMEFPTGTPEIDVAPSKAISIAAGEELVIAGVVTSRAPVMLALRIDDGQSTSYATRVNEERELPPGPFEWRLPISGAKRSNGQLINANDIRRLILFEANSEGLVRVDQFRVRATPQIPAGAIGVSLGSVDAPVIAGLSRIAPGDARIFGKHQTALRRPGLDPVVANGVIGVERLHLDWPRGRAHLSLWVEDIGDWENLPRVLQRRIRVNGVDILYQQKTPLQWINDRYLAGRDREPGPGEDAWTAYGRYRGGLLSADIDVAETGVDIEFAGDGASTFVSAATLEPAGRTSARDLVEAERRVWMTGNFPVDATQTGAGYFDGPTYDLDALSASVDPLKVTLTPGSGARATFLLRSSRHMGSPLVEIDLPIPAADGLSSDIFVAQQRLERTGAGSHLLRRTARMLRGDPSALPIVPGDPRRYEAWLSGANNLRPGAYKGVIRVTVPSGRLSIPLVVDVLPINLPPPSAVAGFYLDEAPHLTWFEETRPQRGAQLGCDLRTLQKFGVSGGAPGLSTPTAAGLAAFVQDARRAVDAGVRAPLFAYTPLKRLLASESVDEAAASLAAAMSALARASVPAPVWSVTDEPGNADQTGGDNLLALAAKLRASAPGIRLGGQFNNPADIKFISAVDAVLINQGFGIDIADVARLRRPGLDVWLYNTGEPRFTAGLWLWMTGASRYLQWHARMPTADPFDPTDGREGDVQVFPPTPEACPDRQDVDLSLIEMAEGLVDQRWLLWLSRRNDADARGLLAKIKSTIPSDWATASKDGATKARAMREDIIELARRLK